MKKVHASRVLPIEGGFNFRELGGIITKEGKTIKSHQLIRTDELSQLNENDLQLLKQLKVKTVVDFRTEQERSISVDRVPESCQNEIHLDIVAANMNSFLSKMKEPHVNYKDLILGFYTDLVISENAMKEYQSFFEVLQNPDNTSIIYHCTAGKDRTGIATALILEALGVDWEIIENDYLMSNEFLRPKYQHYIATQPQLEDLFLVNADYLHHAKEIIEKKFYSMEDYLTDQLKVDIDQMKSIYTE